MPKYLIMSQLRLQENMDVLLEKATRICFFGNGGSSLGMIVFNSWNIGTAHPSDTELAHITKWIDIAEISLSEKLRIVAIETKDNDDTIGLEMRDDEYRHTPQE